MMRSFPFISFLIGVLSFRSLSAFAAPDFRSGDWDVTIDLDSISSSANELTNEKSTIGVFCKHGKGIIVSFDIVPAIPDKSLAKTTIQVSGGNKTPTSVAVKFGRLGNFIQTEKGDQASIVIGKLLEGGSLTVEYEKRLLIYPSDGFRHIFGVMRKLCLLI